MLVMLLDSTVNPLYTISMCARTCYNSREKYSKDKEEDFIRGLIKSGHESPLENASLTLDIIGISRSCSHQLVRHRLASYCQQSQRYVNQENNGYAIPDNIKNDNNKLAIYENAIMDAKNAYKELLSLGVAREDARFVLPEAMLTNITMTMNFREIRHFLRLRLDKHAQWEIRELANKIKDLIISKGWKVLIEDINYEENK